MKLTDVSINRFNAMANKEKNFEDQLNRLIARNFDTAEGYASAVKKVNDPLIADVLKKNREMHHAMCYDLVGELLDNNCEVNMRSTFLGELHHKWMIFLNRITSHSYSAILAESYAAERVILKDYEYVLKSTEMSPMTKHILEKHISQLESIVRTTKVKVAA